MRGVLLVLVVVLMGCQPAERLSRDEMRVRDLLMPIVPGVEVEITDDVVKLMLGDDPGDDLVEMFCTVFFDASLSEAYGRDLMVVAEGAYSARWVISAMDINDCIGASVVSLRGVADIWVDF